jgi:hypothetical protein
MTLDSTIVRMLLQGSQTTDFAGTALDYQFTPSKSITFTNGSGANQALYIGAIDDTCSTSKAAVTLDLDDIDLNAVPVPFGTVAFTSVKALLIINDSTTSGENIIIGNAAATPWVGPLGGTTPTITIPPSSSVMLVNPTAAGWACATGVNDLLRLRAATGTPAFRLFLLGI